MNRQHKISCHICCGHSRRLEMLAKWQATHVNVTVCLRLADVLAFDAHTCNHSRSLANLCAPNVRGIPLLSSHTETSVFCRITTSESPPHKLPVHCPPSVSRRSLPPRWPLSPAFPRPFRHCNRALVHLLHLLPYTPVPHAFALLNLNNHPHACPVVPLPHDLLQLPALLCLPVLSLTISPTPLVRRVSTVQSFSRKSSPPSSTWSASWRPGRCRACDRK